MYNVKPEHPGYEDPEIFLLKGPVPGCNPNKPEYNSVCRRKNKHERRDELRIDIRCDGDWVRIIYDIVTGEVYSGRARTQRGAYAIAKSRPAKK